ncbi:hypothetical protein RCL1_004255 [Eukaryota sp. TZLM3-RCL]
MNPSDVPAHLAHFVQMLKTKPIPSQPSTSELKPSGASHPQVQQTHITSRLPPMVSSGYGVVPQHYPVPSPVGSQNPSYPSQVPSFQLPHGASSQFYHMPYPNAHNYQQYYNYYSGSAMSQQVPSSTLPPPNISINSGVRKPTVSSSVPAVSVSSDPKPVRVSQKKAAPRPKPAPAQRKAVTQKMLLDLRRNRLKQALMNVLLG